MACIKDFERKVVKTIDFLLWSFDQISQVLARWATFMTTSGYAILHSFSAAYTFQATNLLLATLNISKLGISNLLFLIWYKVT